MVGLGLRYSPSLMDTLPYVLFGLTTATVIALSVWWVLRARRLESWLETYAALALLPDRVQALGRKVEDLDPAALRAELDAIRADLARIEDLISAPSGASPPSTVRASIFRHLREDGYRAVTLEDPRVELSEKGSCLLPLSAIRSGVRVRGHVRLLDGEVVETDLEPSYDLFP